MTSDRDLIQIVDAAMAEAVRIGGPWIACKPGCTPCCIDPFPITMLDSARLRSGLDQLESVEPDRAAAVRKRAQEYVALSVSDEIHNRFTGRRHPAAS